MLIFEIIFKRIVIFEQNLNVTFVIKILYSNQLNVKILFKILFDVIIINTKFKIKKQIYAVVMTIVINSTLYCSAFVVNF